jgi:hypothetical protein
MSGAAGVIIGLVIELGFLGMNLATEGSPTKKFGPQTPSDSSFLQNGKFNAGVGELEVPGQRDEKKALMVGTTMISCLSSSISFLCSLMMMLFFSVG